MSNNIRKAIAAVKNQDPSSMADSIELELSRRLSSALDDKKVELATNMFSMENIGDSDDD